MSKEDKEENTTEAADSTGETKKSENMNEKETKEEKTEETKKDEVQDKGKDSKKSKKSAKDSKIEALQKELDETKDTLLRLRAEYANFRKRSEKEKNETYSFATAAAVKELLPVIDNLERAIQNNSKDYDSLQKGVKMTFDGVVESFKKLNVEMYCEKGEIFDPAKHNAVAHVDGDEYKEGEIVEVYQKGYKIGEKIIRPAMVKTAN